MSVNEVVNPPVALATVPLAPGFALEARVKGLVLYFTLVDQWGDPQEVRWLGIGRHDLAVGPEGAHAVLGVDTIHRAQQSAKKLLIPQLREAGWSYRKIARALDIFLRQAERWGSAA